MGRGPGWSIQKGESQLAEPTISWLLFANLVLVGKMLVGGNALGVLLSPFEDDLQAYPLNTICKNKYAEEFQFFLKLIAVGFDIFPHYKLSSCPCTPCWFIQNETGPTVYQRSLFHFFSPTE